MASEAIRGVEAGRRVVSQGTLYVGAKWRTAGGEPLLVVNPATEETIAFVSSATQDEVEDALATAREAQASWASQPVHVRASYLWQIADVVQQSKKELARLLVTEVGKPLAQAESELEWTIAYIRYTAEWARRLDGDIVASDNENEVIHLLRVPLGVVAAICAWNFPLALYFRKVAPALLTGNAVVLKPSEVTPLSSLAVTELIDKHVSLPAGVLNVVTGGADTGRALARSRLTDMVTMTGHRDTGKQIMADAARNLTRVSLELGGKAPAIVWKDADITDAVRALITARHTNAGQVCTCAERIFVHEDIFDAFLNEYSSAARALRLGDPFGDVDMGPLVNAAQLAKTEAAVTSAREEGARLVLGGDRPKDELFRCGFWYEPTVFVDVSPEMRIMRDEIFGPVTPIMKVASLTEAIAHANDSRYGLSAYLFTSDYKVAMRAADKVAFGEIYINRSHGEAVQAHHIGHRESGLGGEDGKYGVLKYTQLKSVYHNYG